MSSHLLRFSITKKIAVPFALILALMVFIGVASLVGYGRATESAQALEEEVLKQSAAGDLRSSLAALLTSVDDYVVTGNVSYRTEYETLRGEVDERIAKCEGCHGSESALTSGEVTSRLDTVRLSIDSVYATAGRIFGLKSVRANPLAGKLMQEMDYRYGNKVYAQVGAMVEPIQQNVASAMLAVQEDRKWGFWLVLIPTLLALAISSVVVILTMQRISKPVLQLVGVAQRIASRDFSVQMQAEAKDEIGLLIVAFNAMAAEINSRYEELESFAYIVAHDLKSPLTGIRGMSEILVTDYKDKLDGDAKEFLETIVASSDRMALLINDLLSFAKAGKIEYSSEAIPIGKMIKEVESDLAFYLKERNAILNVQENLPSILCDPVRFSQIWKNLISNAVKYNENAAPKVEIGFATTNGNQRMYHFYVRDNGIGIDEKQLDRIFMPFQRATTDPKYEGTGIGLAIVKRVVEFHGGKIWVEARKGEGTTFHFTIPKPILT